ncbi:MAG: response regulator transcription factor [Sulfurimonas sp.]
MHSKELLQYSKNLTLLLVEDHDELRENTANVLQNLFKTVDTASNGQEALGLYNENEYDIILTDIRMPQIDGVTLVEAVYEKNPHQIIIVLSAHDESKYLIPLLNLGVEHYIKKPLDYQELLKVFYHVTKKIDSSLNSSYTSKLILNENSHYDKEKKILNVNGEIVYLTKYEIIFLDILSQQLSKIYSNDEIVGSYQTLNENIDAQNIRKLVSKLRKKMPENTIESIYGVGYRLIPNT